MKLQAGQLSLLYENGFLRRITSGPAEVIRMIYFAVRDSGWNTIPSVIADEAITQGEDHFLITYRRLFDTGTVQMEWQAQIRGLQNSTIQFEISGVA
ncbi:MAG TPA: hypothetical protein VGM89_08930, partial [Puia sp.]